MTGGTRAREGCAVGGDWVSFVVLSIGIADERWTDLVLHGLVAAGWRKVLRHGFEGGLKGESCSETGRMFEEYGYTDLGKVYTYIGKVSVGVS